MRIIGGKFKGRRFNPPIGKWPTRPTMDFTKEALFNILANRIDFNEIRVLDLFGGSGSISLEFLSRECEALTYVDTFPACVHYVKGIREELQLNDSFYIVKKDALKFLKNTEEKFNLIFCDPPYDFPHYTKIIDVIFQNEVLQPDGLLILEHDTNIDFSSHNNFESKRKYGNTVFSFLTKK